MNKIVVLLFLSSFYLDSYGQEESKNLVMTEACRCISEYKSPLTDSLSVSQLISDCIFPVLMRNLDDVQREMAVVGDPNAAARQIAGVLLDQLADSCSFFAGELKKLGFLSDLSWVLKNETVKNSKLFIELDGLVEEVNTTFPFQIKLRDKNGVLYSVIWLTQIEGNMEWMEHPKKLVSKEVKLVCEKVKFFYPEKQNYLERFVLTEMSVK